MDLFSPVTALKGVGAVRAKQLAKLHIETLYDLIAFFPRDYCPLRDYSPASLPALRRWSSRNRSCLASARTWSS